MRMFPDFELQFATCLPTADSIAGTQALGLLSATIYVCLHQHTQTQTQTHKSRHTVFQGKTHSQALLMCRINFIYVPSH